jgi:vacuolar-type H+-ATPase subunit H
LNEKRIQQVLDIEKDADAIHNQAVEQAKLLPLQAEQEAQALIEKARLDAEAEAKGLIAAAQAEEERAHIVAQAEEKIRSTDVLAMGNKNKAVSYVLARVVGRE